MNLKLFVESLTSTEKRELLDILTEKPATRVSVREWVTKNEDLSVRAKNSLIYSDIANYFIDEVTSTDLMKVRNLGKVTLQEILESYPIIRK